MITLKPEVCGICGACVAICRQNALFLFNATLQVSGRCNGCNICVNICPLGAIMPEQKKLKQSASGVMPDSR
jgi:MinD superfamily P-loop ATPase